MPRGYRGYLVAALGLIGVCLVVLLSYPEQPKLAGDASSYEHLAGYRAGGSKCEPAAIARLPYRKRAAQTESCREAEDKDHSDTDSLIAARRSAQAADASAVAAVQQARIADWTLLLGGVTMIAAIGAAYFAKQAADWTKESAVAARESVEVGREANRDGRQANNVSREAAAESNRLSVEAMALEQRAWLYPRLTEFTGIHFHNGNMQVGFRYSFQNKGRTHARLVWGSGQLVSQDFDSTLAALNKAHTFIQHGDENRLIFPDEAVPDQGQIALCSAENVMRGDGEGVYGHIIIVLFYRTITDRELHRTIRTYEIYDSTPEGGLTPIIYGRHIPASRLRYAPGRRGNVAD